MFNVSTFYQKDMAEAKISWYLLNILGISSATFSIIQQWFLNILGTTTVVEEISRVSVSILGAVYLWFVIMRIHQRWKRDKLENAEKRLLLDEKIAAAAKVSPVNPGGTVLATDLAYFTDIKKVVNQIFTQTCADRFLILIAKNGKDEMKFCSVMYEEHKQAKDTYLSVGATGRYIDIALDKHYKNMLKQSEIVSHISLVTEKMPESLLKNIYTKEKVTNSELFFLKKVGQKDGTSIMYYATVGTHDFNMFTSSEKILIYDYMDTIKNRTHQHLKHN